LSGRDAVTAMRRKRPMGTDGATALAAMHERRERW
jgi:hypothetical protein